MLNFILWNDAAAAEEGAVAVSSQGMLNAPPAGRTWRPIVGSIQTRTLAVVGGALTEVDRPLPAAIALPLTQQKQWAAAKDYCEARKAAGCVTPLGRVQTDDASRIAIREASDDAATNLVKVPAWSVTWTMSDNSLVVHNASQMVAMGAAVRAYVNACHAASQAIRTRIFAAATPAAAAAIDITAGYPAN